MYVIKLQLHFELPLLFDRASTPPVAVAHDFHFGFYLQNCPGGRKGRLLRLAQKLTNRLPSDESRQGLHPQVGLAAVFILHINFAAASNLPSNF